MTDGETLEHQVRDFQQRVRAQHRAGREARRHRTVQRRERQHVTAGDRDPLHAAHLGSRHRCAVAEVEAQPIGRDQRALLRDMCPEPVAQRLVHGFPSLETMILRVSQFPSEITRAARIAVELAIVVGDATLESVGLHVGHGTPCPVAVEPFE